MSVERERKEHTTSRLQQHQQPHKDSVAHWWVPGRTTHGTPVPLRREAVSGPETQSTRHHHNDETKVSSPRLGYQPSEIVTCFHQVQNTFYFQLFYWLAAFIAVSTHFVVCHPNWWRGTERVQTNWIFLIDCFQIFFFTDKLSSSKSQQPTQETFSRPTSECPCRYEAARCTQMPHISIPRRDSPAPHTRRPKAGGQQQRQPCQAGGWRLSPIALVANGGGPSKGPCDVGAGNVLRRRKRTELHTVRRASFVFVFFGLKRYTSQFQTATRTGERVFVYFGRELTRLIGAGTYSVSITKFLTRMPTGWWTTVTLAQERSGKRLNSAKSYRKLGTSCCLRKRLGCGSLGIVGAGRNRVIRKSEPWRTCAEGHLCHGGRAGGSGHWAPDGLVFDKSELVWFWKRQ